MSLLNKLIKNTTLEHTSILNESVFFTEKDMIPTSIPIINVAFSGRLSGGIVPGLTMWAGPSKHFKTGFMLLCAKAYMDKYPEAPLLFYDSEFGSPLSYFDSFGIDKSRVIHSPITDIEQLKFDIMAQLDLIQRGEKIFIAVDSIGNLASKKEVEDAKDKKSVSDMTRAKQIKSLFRMVTPYLNIKDILMHVVNHTYKEIGLYPKDIVGGGTGSYYSADNIFILGRQQEKDKIDGKEELVGYNFIINVEKSRYVKEKSKIPVTVTFDNGISKYTGLLDLALLSGHVIKPSKGWYSKVDEEGVVEDKKYREDDTNSNEFWDSILKSESFNAFVEKTYLLSSGDLVSDKTISETFESAVEE